MYHDPEILAMSQVYEAFKDLENVQIKRIIDWLTGKFALDRQPVVMPPQPVQEQATPRQEVIEEPKPVVEQPVAQEVPAPVPPPVVEEVPEPPAAPPVKEVKVEEPVEVKEPEPEPQPKVKQEAPKEPSTKNLGIKRYKTIENLFLAADINTVAEKILLAAAYLQEKKGFEEFGSYDINSRLKKMGYGIQNVTNAINSLIRKKPPLLIQTKKEGSTKQSKRKFQITPDGLKIALNCLRKAKS